MQTTESLPEGKKSIVMDLLKYLPNCKFEYWPSISFAARLKILLKGYAVFFACSMVAVGIITVLDNFVPQLFHLDHLMHNDISKFMELMHGSALKTFLAVCIGAPILEETVCRLPLSFKPRHIALSLAVLTLFISGIRIMYLQPLSIGFGLRLLAIVAVYVAAYLFFSNPKYYDAGRLSQSKKRGVIIFSIAMFGFAHILNYKPLHYQVAFLYPVYVVPQLCMGWVFTYVRLRNGLIYSILLHALVNSLPFLLFMAGHQQ